MVESSAVHPVMPQTAAPTTAAVCPYLLAADGRWRSSSPAREHRCTAVAPPAPLATDKQKRLCLVSEHRTCATYLVATGAPDLADAGAMPRAARGDRQGSRELVRTAPLVLDHGRIPLPRAAAGDRSLGQGALLLLMAVAFAAIIVARLSSGTDDGGSLVAAGATGSPSPTPTSAATDGAVASPDAPVRTLVPTEVEPSAEPAGSAPPTTEPEATARPTTYKVQRGDTLSGIAAAFGTTVAELSELNDITDPSRIRIGQVLDLPPE